MGGMRRIGDVVFIQLSDLDSNIYLIGDTVIDSGTGFNFTRLYQALKILKLRTSDIRHIINTHGHFDHVGGNGYFIDAKVSIHEKDAPILEKGDGKLSYADYYDGKLVPREVGTKLKQGDTIQAGTMSLEVMHTPGHTPGSVCLYDKKSGTLFTGDTVFSDGIGRTDMPGGSDEELQESLGRLAPLEFKRLFPGHGDPLVSDKPKKVSDILTAPGPGPDSGEEDE